jgi:hypothetical protein
MSKCANINPASEVILAGFVKTKNIFSIQLSCPAF